MNEPTGTGTGVDAALERAHLLYVRGQNQEARDVLETLLADEPANADARRLRDVIEREMVDEALQENAGNPGYFEEEASNWQVLGAALLGLAMVATGALLAIDPIQQGLARGFSTQIYVRMGAGGGRFPIHFLLMFPVLLVGGGGIVLWALWRSVRGGRKG